MRARYRIPFTHSVYISDHWEIPLLGGICRVQEKDGLAVGLEVVLPGQSLSFAPRIELSREEGVEAHITVDDANVSLIEVQLRDAMAFLSGFCNVDLNWHEVESSYEAEPGEDENAIGIKSFGTSRALPTSVLPFDLLSRAIICSEKERGPAYEATLLASARLALSQQRFIDSFRYSFLLIEAIYGDGKFHKSALKDAMSKSSQFRAAVERALAGLHEFRGMPAAGVNQLRGLSGTDAVIAHLVDQRGLYFHGNVKRKDAWRPERQDEAKALAALAVSIAQSISQEAAGSLFTQAAINRHVDYAKRAGAMIVFKIDYEFRVPPEVFTRQSVLRINAPGTKPTPAATFQLMKQFIGHFENQVVIGELLSSRCTVEGTGEEVFDLRFGKAVSDHAQGEPSDHTK